MQKIKYLIFAISFIEGSCVMIWELLNSKMLSPYFGNSILVWVSVIATTLTGLAIGYFLGALLSKKSMKINNYLIGFFILSIIYTLFVFLFNSSIQEIFLKNSIFAGSLLTSLIINLPILIIYGTISPLLIRLLNDKVENLGRSSSLIYTISTTGGVLMTYLAGLYFIPYVGISQTIIIVISLNTFNLLLVLFLKRFINQNL